MTNYISAMPGWAVLLFILGLFFSVGLIAKPIKQAAINAGMTTVRARAIQFSIYGFFTIYFAYVSILSLKGMFDSNSLPPAAIAYCAVPLMGILFGIGATKVFKKILHAITLESLITLHIFRLVGVFFILLWCYHLLPTEFAFSSGLGDIITALLAFPVARMVSKAKPWGLTALYAWNIFGILDILTLLAIAALDIKHAIVAGGPGDREMTIFPFVWFPAFAPPIILFLHAVIFRKIMQLKRVKTIYPFATEVSTQTTDLTLTSKLF